MDPLRSDPRPAETLSGPERDARIEGLLLAGLDEYFAHRYERAIGLWTRVLFFDRHHGRARAYIERARSAQAEQQRESDAVLQQGVDAFRAGDIPGARRLLADALDRGASPDEAHGILDRIDRLRAAQVAPRARRRSFLSAAPQQEVEETADNRPPAPAVRGWVALVLLAAACVSLIAVATWGLIVLEPERWRIFSADAAATTGVIRWAPEPLPTPQASERDLSRARTLVATGRLHDALQLLERVPIGDPLYDEAQELRARAQRHLLSLAESDLARE